MEEKVKTEEQPTEKSPSEQNPAGAPAENPKPKTKLKSPTPTLIGIIAFIAIVLLSFTYLLIHSITSKISTNKSISALGDFPIYPGAAFVNRYPVGPCPTGTQTDACNSTNYDFKTSDSFKKVYDFYKDKTVNGWACVGGAGGVGGDNINSTDITRGNVTTKCTKNNDIFNLGLNGDKNGTSIHVGVSVITPTLAQINIDDYITYEIPAGWSKNINKEFGGGTILEITSPDFKVNGLTQDPPSTGMLISVGYTPVKPGASMDNAICDLQVSSYKEAGKTLVDGVSAIKGRNIGEGNSGGNTYCLLKNNVVWRISFESYIPDENKYLGIESDFINSFKFTDQNQTVDTSNWKTYTNSSYGFSIGYPGDWITNTSSPLYMKDSAFLLSLMPSRFEHATLSDPGGEFPPEVFVNVIKNSSNLSPIEYVKNIEPAFVSNLKQAKLNGISGVRGPLGGATVNDNFLVNYNGFIYMITFNHAANNTIDVPTHTFDQILSTFKFTK